MDIATYAGIKKQLIERGFANEIEWAENIKPVSKPLDFFCEYAYVIVNSGMKNQIARKIWDKIVQALREDKQVSAVFRHSGKAKAIQDAWLNHKEMFDAYQAAGDKLQYLDQLPFIGPITKMHLAKNLGMEVCKPDRHLVRIAKSFGMTPEELCLKLSKESGDRIVTVDTVIWRAANLGML